MGIQGLRNLQNRCGGPHVLQFVKTNFRQLAALGLTKKPKQRTHPPNMYILYFQDMRQQYLKSYWKTFYDLFGGRSMKSFAQEVSAKWRKLPQAEKDKYKAKYQVLRAKQIAEEKANGQQKLQESLAWKAKVALEKQQALLAAQQRKATEAWIAQKKQEKLVKQQQVNQILQQLQAQAAAPAPVPQGAPVLQ